MTAEQKKQDRYDFNNAIETLTEARQTHIDWLKYYQENPGTEDLPENINAGNAEHQKKWIDAYDKAIAEIKADKTRISELEDENKKLRVYKKFYDHIRTCVTERLHPDEKVVCTLCRNTFEDITGISEDALD